MKPPPPNVRVFGVDLPGRPEYHADQRSTLSVDEVKLVAANVELRGATQRDYEDIRQGPQLWRDYERFANSLFVALPLFATPEFDFHYDPRVNAIRLTAWTEAARRVHPVVGIVSYLLDARAEFRRQEMLADLVDHLDYETGVLPGRLTCELKQCFMHMSDFDFDDAVSAVHSCRDAAQLRTVLRGKYPGRPTVLVRHERDWERRHEGGHATFAGAGPDPEEPG